MKLVFYLNEYLNPDLLNSNTKLDFQRLMQLRSVAGLWWHPSKELICKEHSVELAGALKRPQETEVASPVALRRHGGQDLVAAGLAREVF